MEQVDAIVVGAGVIGLAIARALARAGRAVLIVEREPRFGGGISSRNSEVIHAGLHYPPASLKARLCVEGRDRLYSYCERRGVPHRRTGKLVFADDDKGEAALDAIAANALACGAGPLRRLDRAGVKRIEPALDAPYALLSPTTGIVDSHALMLALLGDAEAAGATFAGKAPVERIGRAGRGWTIQVDGSATVTAPVLVNAAGLGAQALASTIEGLDAVPPLFLARGSYFTCSVRPPFRHLVYPVPEPGGLGIHLTLDLAGGARFGPDVEWVDAVDFRVDPARKPAFVAQARRVWPALDPALLQPGFAGIRPKLAGPGQPEADFVIAGPEAHGLDGLVNLFGIESPGLTSCLAIAREVVGRLD